MRTTPIPSEADEQLPKRLQDFPRSPRSSKRTRITPSPNHNDALTNPPPRSATESSNGPRSGFGDFLGGYKDADRSESFLAIGDSSPRDSRNGAVRDEPNIQICYGAVRILTNQELELPSLGTD